MKKALLSLGTVLTLSGVLTGCNWDNNAANDNNPRTRDIAFRPDDNRNGVNRGDQNQNLTNQNNVRDNGTQMNQQDRDLAKKIADRAKDVEGVERAHVVVTGDRVLIGLDPANGRAENANLDEEVRSAVQNLARDRDVYVSSDINLVRRITDVETNFNGNNFNANNGANEVRSDIVGIIDDLTNAIQRPFENNDR